MEEVCRFPELPARKPLTYQAKQLIAREIEVEKMRRAEARTSLQVSPSPCALTDPSLLSLRLSVLPSHPRVPPFLQVSRGAQGAESVLGCTGDRGTAPPAGHSREPQREQRLEHILQRAALEEQVCRCLGEGLAGVGPIPSGLTHLLSHSPRGTFLVASSSGEQPSLCVQVCGDSVCVCVWGCRAATDQVFPTEDLAPEAEAAERRMGTAVGRSDVWFRFKEGVSNAVRRSLYIRDLL